jgi:hypothetical protein
MRAATILLVLLAAGCGSLDERACSSSADCAAGLYCARTPDGGVCWPDAVRPTVSSVTVTCGTPCRRDATLQVEARIADDVEVASAEVALDLGGAPVRMAPEGGGVWSALVPLREFPFDSFTQPVVATVTARDGARNPSFEVESVVTVTRLAWERSYGAALGHPAVSQDGIVATPANSGTVFLATWDGEHIASVTVGSGAPQVLTAPLASATSVWVGSSDGRVYELSQPVSGEWEAIERKNTLGAVRGSLALTSAGFVIATSASGAVYAITSSTSSNSSVRTPLTMGPVIDLDRSIYAVSGGAVRRLTVDDLGFLAEPVFAATIGAPVTVDLAAAGGMIAVANNGTDGLLRSVDAAGGDPESIATTAIPSGGVVVVGDGSILVPEETKSLSRWRGSVLDWSEVALPGIPSTPLVTTGSGTPILVATTAGSVHALASNGSIIWTGLFSEGVALQPGNIYTPVQAAAGPVLSLAYFAGADGVLHAVIVDGQLDTSAPWPKAFHDPQNTNRAGVQP